MNVTSKNDLKQFGLDLKNIYPAALKNIIQNWKIAILCFLLIIICFYFDNTIRILFADIHTGFTEELFALGRWYGNGQATAILFLILYTFGIAVKNPKLKDTGLLIGISYICSGLITLLTKCVFGRWRPYTEHGSFSFDGWHLTGNDYYSFFSGHSQTAFAISVILAARTDNIYLKIFYYALAVNTALSRIFHDQHWLSDVVAGAIVAIVIGKQLIVFHDKRLKTFSQPVLIQADGS